MTGFDYGMKYECGYCKHKTTASGCKYEESTHGIDSCNKFIRTDKWFTERRIIQAIEKEKECQ